MKTLSSGVLEKVLNDYRQVPCCSVCGEEMSPGKVDGSGIMWTCDSESASTVGKSFGSPEYKKAKEHYNKSKLYRRSKADSRVVSAISELLELRKQS